jgi:hypothetical protein
VLDIAAFGGLQFMYEMAQMLSQHKTCPLGQVIGVGHKKLEVTQFPDVHLTVF